MSVVVDARGVKEHIKYSYLRGNNRQANRKSIAMQTAGKSCDWVSIGGYGNKNEGYYPSFQRSKHCIKP